MPEREEVRDTGNAGYAGVTRGLSGLRADRRASRLLFLHLGFHLPTRHMHARGFGIVALIKPARVTSHVGDVTRRDF